MKNYREKTDVPLERGVHVPSLKLERLDNGRCTGEHMLRGIDKNTFSALATTLINNGLDVYLGGSVAENHWFGLNKEYGDIDLLAIVKKATNRAEALYFPEILMNAEDNGFGFRDYMFDVKFKGNSNAYFNVYNLINGYSFTVTPKPRWNQDLFSRGEHKPFDLTITTSKEVSDKFPSYSGLKFDEINKK